MKIYKRKEFLELPEGTLYSVFTPNDFTGLWIKESEPGKYSNDFDKSNLIGINADANEFSWICNLMAKGVPRAIDTYIFSRDGFFNEGDMYAVYDKDDIEHLIERLQDLIDG